MGIRIKIYLLYYLLFPPILSVLLPDKYNFGNCPEEIKKVRIVSNAEGKKAVVYKGKTYGWYDRVSTGIGFQFSNDCSKFVFFYENYDGYGCNVNGKNYNDCRIYDFYFSPDSKDFFFKLATDKGESWAKNGIAQGWYVSVEDIFFSADSKYAVFWATNNKGLQTFVVNGNVTGWFLKVEDFEFHYLYTRASQSDYKTVGIKEGATRYSFKAYRNDGKVTYVVDGKQLKYYNYVEGIKFSGDNKHFVFVAEANDKKSYVLDGNELGWFTEVSNFNFDIEEGECKYSFQTAENEIEGNCKDSNTDTKSTEKEKQADKKIKKSEKTEEAGEPSSDYSPD